MPTFVIDLCLLSLLMYFCSSIVIHVLPTCLGVGVHVSMSVCTITMFPPMALVLLIGRFLGDFGKIAGGVR